MSKMYVYWRIIDEFEVSLSFEDSKLLIVVLAGEIKWNNISFVFDVMLLDEKIIILNIKCSVKGSKVVF